MQYVDTIRKTCLNCKNVFDAPLTEHQRGNAKFCSLSCSTSYNNKHRDYSSMYVQDKSCVCIQCGNKFLAKTSNAKCCSQSCRNKHNYCTKQKSPEYLLPMLLSPKWINTTKAELKIRYKLWSTATGMIRKHSRYVYFKSKKPYKCHICKYDIHVNVAHIKGIAAFSDDSKIYKINHIDNLIALCPNHHWELDHKLLKVTI